MIFKSSSYIISKNLLNNLISLSPKSPYIATIRGKKYFRPWWKHEYLNDYWNLSQRKPQMFEMWNEQFENSGLPSNFKALDIQRLPDHLKFRSKGRVLPVRYKHEKSMDYKRRLYGLYGAQSGVNLGELFGYFDQVPNYAEDIDVKRHIDESKFKNQEQRQVILKKMESIKSKLEKLPEDLNKYEARVSKKSEKLKSFDAKNEAILERARDEFGYNISAKDTKFLAFKEKLKAAEDEERKLAKKAQRKKM